MKKFHFYLFKLRTPINQPGWDAVHISRNINSELSPASRSAGSAEYRLVEAANLRDAKAKAFEIAPKVYAYGSEVRH